MRDKISAAQSHADKAKRAVASAVSAEKNKDAPSLELALSDASGEIDQLSAELLSSQTALTSLEKQTSDQTDSLNRADIEKNSALRSLDIERAKTKAIVKQRNRLFLLLAASVIWIFRTPLLALVKLIASLITKLPI